jgi:hypothetical protein
MTYQVIWEKNSGILEGELPSPTQGGTLETFTILALYRDGSNVDLSDKTLSATMTDRDGNTTAVTGTLTGADGSFTWELSEGDIGQSGRYSVVVTYTDGSESWPSVPIVMTIIANPSANAVQNPALVGVPASDALWLAASADGGVLGELAYIDDAPSDGTVYARQDGAWAEAVDATLASDVAELQSALIPVAVADLAAAASGSDAIDLSWTYTAVAYISSFKLYRKEGIGGTYALIDSPASGATSYADSGLTASTEYYYRLDAANDFFATAGNEANDTTDASTEISTTLAIGDIVPTLGSELVTNGDMELDANWSDLSAPTTNERSSEQAHTGTYSRKIVGSANGSGISQNISVANGLWYQVNTWTYVSAAAARIQSSVPLSFVSSNMNTAAWTQKHLIGRATATGTAALAGVQSGINTCTAYFDDFSLKEVQLSSALDLLGDILRSTGTWRSTPTVESGTQAGLAINYTDENNLVLAYVNRYDGKAYLDKRVAGTWTNVINDSITYGAGKELAVVVDGTGYSLYYDGAQVGTQQTIADSLGTAVYGFTTDAANGVGNVATDPATTYAPA